MSIAAMPARFGHYLAAARELEEALRLNKSDTEFSRPASHTIVYIIDTNAAVHYLEQRRRGRQGEQGEFSFGSFLRDGIPAQVNDQLTVEYLLSGSLPGQNGAPIYLMPPHWNEILDRASDTAKKLARFPQVVPEAKIEQLRAISDIRKRIERAQEILPDWIIDALKVAGAVSRRLNTAFAAASPKLEPLDRHPEYWSPAMDRVRTGDIRIWRSAILHARLELRQPRSTNAHTKNLDNDAIALSMMQALYRENEEACGENRTVQFLFVTADRGLIKAVEDRRDDLGREGIPLFARHPKVFSPVLNFSRMTQARERGRAIDSPELRRVFEEVERTLQRLLVFDDPDSRSTGRIRRWEHAKQEELEASMDRWSEAARQLAVAQAHFFALDSDAIAEAAELLGSEEALRAAGDALTETISSIRSRHVRFQALEALRRVATAMSRRPKGRTAARRAPLQVIGVDLLDPVRNVLPPDLAGEDLEGRGRGLHLLLDRLASPGADSQFPERLGQELLNHWEEPAAQLLAACLYLGAEAWPSARECADRCRLAVGFVSALRREADYCYALASRLMLGTPGAFEAANKVLYDHAMRFRHDRLPGAQLAHLRDLVEHAALLSSGSILQAIDDSTPFSSDLAEGSRLLSERELIESFDTAHGLEGEARSLLDDNFSGPIDGFTGIIETLRLQLFTNIVGTQIFKRTLGKKVSGEPFRPNELRNALARLEDECPRPRPVVTEVYIAVSRVILDPTRASATDAMILIDEILKEPHLPLGDQAEYRHLRDFLHATHLEVGQAA